MRKKGIYIFNGASPRAGMTINQCLRTFFIASGNETKTIFSIKIEDVMTECKVYLFLPNVQYAELASTKGTLTQMTAFQFNATWSSASIQQYRSTLCV